MRNVVGGSLPMETPVKALATLAALFISLSANIAFAVPERAIPAHPYVGQDDGYTYVWVNSPEETVRGAVCHRVELGGHGPKGNLRTVYICRLPR